MSLSTEAVTMASASASAILPSKKRKSSHDSAAASRSESSYSDGLMTATSLSNLAEATAASHSNNSALIQWKSEVGNNSKLLSQVPPKKRRASFDVTNFASEGPLRKRKLSEGRLRLFSIGSLEDCSIGLGPMDSIVGANDGLLSVSDSACHLLYPTSDDRDTVATIPLPSTLSTGALDHLEALGDEASSILANYKVKQYRPGQRDEEESQASSSSHTMAHGDRQLLVEALMGNSFKRRDRFESWGGMSDISITMCGSTTGFGEQPIVGETTAAAAAIAASALQRPFLEDESDNSTVTDTDNPVPSKISLSRDRIYSIASIGEPSINSGYEVGSDIQKYVSAAMATVDHLAELARVVETVAGSSNSVSSDLMKEIIRDDHSDIISNASSLPEIQAELQRQRQEDRSRGRKRSLSSTSNAISVDYDAVAAAVDAAEAATGALDLASFAGIELLKSEDAHDSQQLTSFSSKSERDMEEIRARARAAAGYVPPENGELTLSSGKKKSKPSASQKTVLNKGKQNSYVPEASYSMYSAANKAAAQKWDEMFECLLEFVEDQKVDTTGMTEKEKKELEWDGNVPTTFKTKDGKALGRWINNQRSAKHKGVLRKERELKLMSTGLKWSVLSTNSWQDMMDELHLYVAEKTKDGSEWDGNVPTNYKIKGSSSCLDENGEERNLGRWINRQRSLYQAGKLRKDRETVSHFSHAKSKPHVSHFGVFIKELEAIGLKWSVLSTTSWESMYETLLLYVQERKDAEGEWDGNVPANYKTNDTPPKALGRWINRQRTAKQKHKLKKEFADKLNLLGLKWSVHERRSIIPVSQLQTPIKSNVTAVKSAVSAVNSTTIPEKIEIPESSSSLPEEVTSCLTIAVENSHEANIPSSQVSFIHVKSSMTNPIVASKPNIDQDNSKGEPRMSKGVDPSIKSESEEVPVFSITEIKEENCDISQ
jgi:Helicase associated domain